MVDGCIYIYIFSEVDLCYLTSLSSQRMWASDTWEICLLIDAIAYRRQFSNKREMLEILFKIDFSYLFCPWHILLSTLMNSTKCFFTGLMSKGSTTKCVPLVSRSYQIILTKLLFNAFFLLFPSLLSPSRPFLPVFLKMKRRLPSSGTSTIFMLSQTTSTHSFSWSDWGLFLLLVSLQIFSLPADVHCLPVSRVSYLPVVLSHWYIPSLAPVSRGLILQAISGTPASSLMLTLTGFLIQKPTVTGMLVSGTM